MKAGLASFVAIALGVAASAHAQEWRPERPYRGLFAGGTPDAEQSLTATASVGTGWDKNLIADFGGRSVLTRGETPFRAGAVTGSGVLAYSLQRSPMTLSASAGGSAYYYPRVSRQVITREYLSTRGTLEMGYGFSAYGAVAYQPYSLRNMFASAFETAEVDTAALDFPASREHYLAESAGLGYRRRLSRTRTFSAGYGYQHRSSGASLRDYTRHGASAQLSQQMSRGLNLTLGYGYGEAWYGDGDRFKHHNIDVGVNYSRALSFSRRTTLSFGTGTSASRTEHENSLQYHMSGAARLMHEIGRTWGAVLAYARGLQFHDGWPEPVFTDAVSTGVGGSINRRTQLQFGAQALLGHGYRGRRGDVEAYSAGASLGFAVTRYVNTSLTYAYYRHAFGRSTAIGPGFPREFDGQTIRAAVSVWAPLYQRARRP